MAMFDNLISSALSTAASSLLKDTDGDGQIQAIQIVTQLAQQNGGLSGLLNLLQNSGLSSVVQSWIGNGANASVDASQIQNALGGSLGQVASKLGLDTAQASGLLAQYLPQIIHSITPNGNASDANGIDLGSITQLVMQNLIKK